MMIKTKNKRFLFGVAFILLIGHPHSPSAETETINEPSPEILIDESLPEYAKAAYLGYALNRAGYGQKLREKNPGKTYSQTFEEQLEAYEAAANIWSELKESNPRLGDPRLDFIAAAYVAGHLEALVMNEYEQRFPDDYKHWIASNTDRLNRYRLWKNEQADVPSDLKLDNHVSIVTNEANKYPLAWVPEGTYVNPNFPLEFSKEVGHFQSDKVTLYDPSEENFSVGYTLNSSDLDVAATVYVYPALGQDGLPYPADQHFEELKSDIRAYYPDATLILETPTEIPSDGGTVKGKVAIFSYHSALFGSNSKIEHLWSQLYLFSYGKWFIKFRVTYPDAKREGGDGAVKNFINSFHIPSHEESSR